MIVEWNNGGGPEMDGIFEEWKEEKKAKNKSFMEKECSIYFIILLFSLHRSSILLLGHFYFSLSNQPLPKLFFSFGLGFALPLIKNKRQGPFRDSQ
ncbi:hypothetical protein NC652_028615 [Populus alba x Populus x berolinensis]|nr:hypothetical protein NC652_028615 [Populus alba x Populus x berolinensis]